MSVKKLLCGAALASLIAAPAASALTVKPNTGSVTVKLANELDLSTALTGTLPQLVVDTTTDLPVADDYLLTITLTGGAVFDSFNPVTALASANAGTVAGQIVSTGGNDGDTTVAVLFDVTTAALNDGVTLDLPISLGSCASDISVNIELRDNNGNAIEGGTASLTEIASTDAENIIECGSAFDVVIGGDDDAVNGTTFGIDSVFSLASDFEDFLAAVSPNTNDVAAAAAISIVAVDVDTTFDKDLGGTAVGFADIDGVEFDLNFTDATGFATTELTKADVAGSSTLTVDDSASPVFAVDVDPGADNTDVELILNVTGTEAPVVQQPTVTSAVVNFVAGFSDEAATVVGSGSDDLNLEGASFGPYDWVGDAAKGTANIFRVTGVSATPPTAAVTLANSSEGVNGTYTITLDPANVSNGEYLIRASDIEAAAMAPFGRADVTFTFFTSDAIDVDRLLSTGGIVTSYGNAANGDD